MIRLIIFLSRAPLGHGAQKRDPNGNGDDGDAPHKDGDVAETTGGLPQMLETLQGYTALRVQ